MKKPLILIVILILSTTLLAQHPDSKKDTQKIYLAAGGSLFGFDAAETRNGGALSASVCFQYENMIYGVNTSLASCYVKWHKGQMSKHYWDMLDFDAFCGFRLTPSKWEVSVSLVTGFSCNVITRYKLALYVNDNENPWVSDISDAQQHLGYSTFVSVPISKDFGQKWRLSISPYFSSKLLDDMNGLRNVVKPAYYYGCHFSACYRIK